VNLGASSSMLAACGFFFSSLINTANANGQTTNIKVANCYFRSTSHGALLISNDSDESQSLVAINANEIQISEMIAFMAEAIQGCYRTDENAYLN
jgi:hypothetical protein